MKIVNYAVNGAGVGHLARLVAINRWIRRYAAYAGSRAEIYFLTSSEAESLLFHERFAGFKLPSKTVIGDAGIDKLAYLALAKQWVWHSLGLLRPDLLIVDTFPRGSFGELLSALDLCRQRAFVYRPVKDEFSERADFQAMLPLYDAILVPDDTPVKVPDSIRSRVKRFGPVAMREPGELAPREVARAQLGIAPDKLAIYCSAGGGGDAQAQATLDFLCEQLGHDESLHLVVASGPLYRGPTRFGPRITWLRQWGTAELLPACDLAICAAGYNTCAELWLAGVPALFLPQEKIADEQARRARKAEEAGAGQVLSSLFELPAALEPWRCGKRREEASRAARTLAPRNHARDMAAAALGLVLPPAKLEAAREAFTDATLERMRSLRVEADQLARLAHALSHEPDGRMARPSLKLLETMQREGLPFEAGVRLTQAFARKVERADPRAKARALTRLVPELSAFHNWNAVASLFRLLGAEREASPEELAERLIDYLGRARRRGLDLYAAVQRLSEAQGVGGEASKLPTNSEVLERACL